MRRQLRATGGITNARQGYGLGSWVKERIRKLIPNELASVASKAAPFVAPFYPGAAALMRGIGRFDERGSMSDALKQGLGTYAFGKGARYLGGAEGATGGPGSYSMEGFREGPIGRTWDRMMPERQVTDTTPTGNQGSFDATTHDLLPGDTLVPGVDTLATAGSDKLSLKSIKDKWNNIPPGMQTAIVGVGSGTLAGLAQWFENQIPQEPGEDMTAYLARRKVAVGKLMREYMDSTRAYEAEWTSMTDEEKNEEVANLNYNQGGRVGYQTGGISMGNTLAQNIAANQAQAAKVNQIIQQARTKLPGAAPQAAAASGLTSLTQSFQPQTRSQARTQLFGGPPSGGPTTTPFKPSLQTGTQTPGPPPSIPGMGGMNPEDFMKLSEAEQIKRMDADAAREAADMKKYTKFYTPQGTTPRTVDIGAGKIAYRDILQVLKMDYPQAYANLTGNETLEELDELSGQLAGYWSKGGRVGLYGGGGLMRRPGYMIGGEAKQMEAGAPPIIYEGNMDPSAQAGLPSIPGPMRMAKDGPEFDMRQRGGFQPLGRQEGKDDVPAMLAKNEFVMTADAVRAAGGGSINKGAQRMYDTMKKLERRVS